MDGAVGQGWVVRPLTAESWPAFEALAARHKSVWGGCWCMAFHPKGPGWKVSSEANRREKAALVQAGRAHAALVMEGGDLHRLGAIWADGGTAAHSQPPGL